MRLGSLARAVPLVVLLAGHGLSAPQCDPNVACVRTMFASDIGTGENAAFHFDLTVTRPVTVSGLCTNLRRVQGPWPEVFRVLVTPDTYVGKERDRSLWTVVAEDDGTTQFPGLDQPTYIRFAQPWVLTPGSYGVALRTRGMAHHYGIDQGMSTFSSADGTFTIQGGAVTQPAFSATGAIFTPRVWNGQLCADQSPPLGDEYCTPAATNSTGAWSSVAAFDAGATPLSAIRLVASDVPPSSFGFFLSSLDQDLVVGPGGSAGNLCLGGAIGRFVGPGQIGQAGADGELTLTFDPSSIPTPTGPVSAMSGDRWNFQAWYRDVGPAGPTSNFSSGIEIAFP